MCILYNKFILNSQKMGQTYCCESNTADKDLILNFNNMKTQDPIENSVSNTLRKSIAQNTLISKRGFEEGVDGDFVQEDPMVTQAVYSRITNLSPLNIPEVYFQVRGKEEPTYFKLRKTGVVYAGEWKDGVPNGYGKSYYPNGGIYEGTFIDGISHGYGRFIMPNGDYYQGEIKFGRANGFGSYETDSSSYKGSFKDNVRHGKGQQKGQDYFFSGEYEYGEKKCGLYKYNGNVYEGDFVDGLFNGKGKLTTSQGQYTGEFKQGQQHGKGQFKWVNGSSYRGSYFRGQREGYGEYYNSKNSSISKGIWKKGVLSGEGEYIQPRGEVHKCVWSNGKISAILDK